MVDYLKKVEFAEIIIHLHFFVSGNILPTFSKMTKFLLVLSILALSFLLVAGVHKNEDDVLVENGLFADEGGVNKGLLTEESLLKKLLRKRELLLEELLSSKVEELLSSNGGLLGGIFGGGGILGDGRILGGLALGGSKNTAY